MPYKLTVNHPSAGEGAQLSIHGLGVFENGKVYKIDDELADQFRRMNGNVVQAQNEQGQATTSEFVLGPTLLEAEIYGVTVESMEEEQPTQQDQNNEEVDS